MTQFKQIIETLKEKIEYFGTNFSPQAQRMDEVALLFSVQSAISFFERTLKVLKQQIIPDIDEDVNYENESNFFIDISRKLQSETIGSSTSEVNHLTSFFPPVPNDGIKGLTYSNSEELKKSLNFLCAEELLGKAVIDYALQKAFGELAKVLLEIDQKKETEDIVQKCEEYMKVNYGSSTELNFLDSMNLEYCKIKKQKEPETLEDYLDIQSEILIATLGLDFFIISENHVVRNQTREAKKLLQTIADEESQDDDMVTRFTMFLKLCKYKKGHVGAISYREIGKFRYQDRKMIKEEHVAELMSFYKMLLYCQQDIDRLTAASVNDGEEEQSEDKACNKNGGKKKNGGTNARSSDTYALTESGKKKETKAKACAQKAYVKSWGNGFMNAYLIKALAVKDIVKKNLGSKPYVRLLMRWGILSGNLSQISDNLNNKLTKLKSEDPTTWDVENGELQTYYDTLSCFDGWDE